MKERILIFGTTRESATAFLESIIDKTKNEDIHRFKKSVNETFVELKDGTIYQVVSVSQSSRGRKCDKAYIECGINREIINCLIEPMLVVSSLPEEEQIEYF